MHYCTTLMFDMWPWKWDSDMASEGVSVYGGWLMIDCDQCGKWFRNCFRCVCVCYRKVKQPAFLEASNQPAPRREPIQLPTETQSSAAAPASPPPSPPAAAGRRSPPAPAAMSAPAVAAVAAEEADEELYDDATVPSRQQHLPPAAAMLGRPLPRRPPSDDEQEEEYQNWDGEWAVSHISRAISPWHYVMMMN